jgi:hypothetical protein
MTVKSVITATIFYQAKCIFGELFQRFLKVCGSVLRVVLIGYLFPPDPQSCL